MSKCIECELRVKKAKKLNLERSRVNLKLQLSTETNEDRIKNLCTKIDNIDIQINNLNIIDDNTHVIPL